MLITKPYLESTDPAIRQLIQALLVQTEIIQVIGKNKTLRDTLENALNIVLKAVNSSVGWICLLEENDVCTSFVGYHGVSFTSRKVEFSPCLAKCVCYRVKKTRREIVINHLAEGCPLVMPTLELDAPVSGHIAVPLVFQKAVVGLLNVAFTRSEQINQINVRLIKSIGPQLAVAIENARLRENLKQKEQLRKHLLKKAVSAHEEERRRISRELHDQMGQELTSLMILLNVVENQRSSDPEKVKAVLGEIRASVSQMFNFIHDLAQELRPTALDDLGLGAALKAYFRDCQRRLGIQVEFKQVGLEDGRLSREVETTVFRIVQEAITNVARHSNIGKAQVILKFDEGAVTAVIEDQGIGFDIRAVDPSDARSVRKSLGLFGMEERAALLGGTVSVESVPGCGTTIIAKIPSHIVIHGST